MRAYIVEDNAEDMLMEPEPSEVQFNLHVLKVNMKIMLYTSMKNLQLAVIMLQGCA